MLIVFEKIKEAIFSVLPIFIVTIIISFLFTKPETSLLIQFSIGSLLMVIGMPIFLLGIDISVSRMGEQISEVLTKSNKLWVLIVGGALFGIIITVAEPDLHILAEQVSLATGGSINYYLLILLVSVGTGLMVSLAMLRILKNFRLNIFMTILYSVILILSILTNKEFIAISFDSSGSATGSVSVPFILAIAAGVSSKTRSNEKEENDGFGLLGIASTGAIIAIMFQGIFSKGEFDYSVIQVEEIINQNAIVSILSKMSAYAIETIISLLPVVIIYLLVNIVAIKSNQKQLKRIVVGVVYTFIGLVLFLTGVNSGFIEMSRNLGYQIAMLNHPFLLILVGMIFGVITIPAEPSVHILTKQIEDETAGSIKSSVVMFALCIGVSFAVGLSILRILILDLQLWHILLPGMIIAIVLSFIVPDIFVGIAFDSGGVSAGTMTAVFILPYAQGAAAYVPGAHVVLDAFGVIALVAMTPLISLQLLGLIYKLKVKRVNKVSIEEKVDKNDR